MGAAAMKFPDELMAGLGEVAVVGADRLTERANQSAERLPTISGER
jgi:hypothetical protein